MTYADGSKKNGIWEKGKLKTWVKDTRDIKLELAFDEIPDEAFKSHQGEPEDEDLLLFLTQTKILDNWRAGTDIGTTGSSLITLPTMNTTE